MMERFTFNQFSSFTLINIPVIIIAFAEVAYFGAKVIIHTGREDAEPCWTMEDQQIDR